MNIIIITYASGSYQPKAPFVCRFLPYLFAKYSFSHASATVSDMFNFCIVPIISPFFSFFFVYLYMCSMCIFLCRGYSTRAARISLSNVRKYSENIIHISFVSRFAFTFEFNRTIIRFHEHYGIKKKIQHT